jgi:hypothetical protein
MTTETIGTLEDSIADAMASDEDWCFSDGKLLPTDRSELGLPCSDFGKRVILEIIKQSEHPLFAAGPQEQVAD